MMLSVSEEYWKNTGTVFMNLGFDIEINEKLVQKIYWYPLEEIILEDAVND